MVDRDIRRYVFNIILTIIIVILSIPLWNKSDARVGASIASSFTDMDININFEGFDGLSIINDESSYMIKGKNVSLRNPSRNLKNYKLVYMLSKTSTVPYEDVRIQVNDKINKLSECEYFEDDNFYYFILDESNLSAYSNKDYQVKIWLSDKSNVSIHDTLTGTFITK